MRCSTMERKYILTLRLSKGKKCLLDIPKENEVLYNGEKMHLDIEAYNADVEALRTELLEELLSLVEIPNGERLSP